MHTRFHHLVECLRQGRYDIPYGGVDLSAKKAGPRLQEVFDNYLEDMRNLPLFTIDTDALKLITKEDCQRAVKAMVEADVLHLPFPACLIETDGGRNTDTDHRDIAYISEAKDAKNAFYTQIITHSRNGKADLAAIWPGLIKTTANADGSFTVEHFHLKALADQLGKSFEEKYQSIAPHLVRLVGRALSVGLVLLFTRGIAKERIVAEAKLQKSRRKSGKEAIPTYTHIKIGTVYDREGNPHKYTDSAGRKMPVHLRRAHNRHVAHGKGRTERKLLHFPAVIVNYKPEDDRIVIKHYGVTA